MSKIGSLCMYPFQTALWASFQANFVAIFRAENFYRIATLVWEEEGEDASSPGAASAAIGR